MKTFAYIGLVCNAFTLIMKLLDSLQDREHAELWILILCVTTAVNAFFVYGLESRE